MARRLLAVILLMSAAFCFAADKAKELQQLMSVYNQAGQFNGSVLVADQGKIIFEKGYGWANMEWRIPNTPTTKFRLGSITKQFTSMLVMQLVAEGKLSLDDKLSSLLPYYRKDTGGKVTLKHLLTHTSGIPSYTDDSKLYPVMSKESIPVKDFVLKYCSGDLQFEPGTNWRYDNSGYFLLGAILEQATGKPYEALLRERIFEPLGMNDTGYDHLAPVIPRRASGYRRIPTGTYDNAEYLDMSVPYAAGSLYSTVEDLYKWDQALYTEKLLPAKYKEIMWTPVMQNYAFGWGVRSTNGKDDVTTGEKIMAHNGGINGFSSLERRFPEGRELIVLLSNIETGRLNRIADQIHRVLHNQPYAPPKRSAAEAVASIVEARGVDAGIAEYRRLKANEPQQYDFSEGEMNALGYYYLGTKKNSAAIAVLKLNAEEFPRSGNVYDSLGEAYAADGQKELAIANYEKSLQLDPTNKNAEQVLKQLRTPAEPPK